MSASAIPSIAFYGSANSNICFSGLFEVPSRFQFKCVLPIDLWRVRFAISRAAISEAVRPQTKTAFHAIRLVNAIANVRSPEKR